MWEVVVNSASVILGHTGNVFIKKKTSMSSEIDEIEKLCIPHAITDIGVINLRIKSIFSYCNICTKDYDSKKFLE